MNSFLKKILASTGLVRGGRLGEATALIQQALSAAVAAKAPPAAAPTQAQCAAREPAVADMLDDCVRDIEPPALASIAHIEARQTVEPEIRVEADAAAPAAHCSSERFTESSYTGAAGTRTFKLFEPAGCAGRALPLVVMLHGCKQDPDDFALGTRMNALAQEQGFFVLYPAQAPRSNAYKCWNWFAPGDQRRGHGEPALLAGMTRHVMATHAVDADRVFVAGLSAGGAMAAILAREYCDLYAAAGVHSGLAAGAAHDAASAFAAMKSGSTAALPGSWPGLGTVAPTVPLAAWPRPAPVEVDDRLQASRGAPLIVFHGDADSTVNLLNGSHVVDSALGAEAWQSTRDGPDTAGAAVGRRLYTRTVYHPAGAAPETPSRVEHWIVHGAGHAWSGGDASGSFADAAGPDASREMLRFFAAHPRSHAAATHPHAAPAPSQ